MKLKDAIVDFLEEKKFQNISTKTQQNYSDTVYQFLDYCDDKNITDLKEVTANVVKGYIIYCRDDRNNNPVSLNSKLLILKVFFNYLVNEDIILLRRASKLLRML